MMNRNPKLNPTARRIGSFLMLLFIAAGLVAPSGTLLVQAAPAVQAPEAPAAAAMLTLKVISARTEPEHPGGLVNAGDPVPGYSYLINVDNTGNPTQPRYPDCSAWIWVNENDHSQGMQRNPTYPDSCDWPSVRQMPAAAPIFTQGDQASLDLDTGIGACSSGAPQPCLPDGKYLISVQAEGYKIGGMHFTVPLSGTGQVTVALQPHPLPPASMQIKVFDDISPTNGMFDSPGENGLAGAKVLINDILGQVSTDVFGNPLCTEYDANGDPLPPPAGKAVDWCLYSDANGDILVPNLGPNRYDVNVVPPQDGQNWIQTSTLEGSHSWDTWLQENGTGLDNEFVNAGEPFPWTVFGFVRQMDQLNNTSVTGGISGRIVAASVYVPQTGGLPYYGGQWGGLNGAKITGPIQDAWIALADLQNGDTTVYVQPAAADGTFTISNVPDGNYFFTYWDYRQMYILDWMQVTVANGQVTDLGTPFLTGWFTFVDGYVFNDTNGNGFKDEGEQGVSEFLVVLKDRDNTEIDRMTIAVTTDHNGYYYFDRAYPMGSWMILEAYSDRYYTTGVSYKVENQPDWTTVPGSGVDVGILPILGHSGRLDWGVRAYDTTGKLGPRNGGIVGTVFYDTTRNELDARYQAVEGWAPGIPGVKVQLWQPVICGTTGAACDAAGMYELAADGSYAKGKLLNETLTETWEQPLDCQARDANGNPLLADPFLGEASLAPATGGYRCLEGPLTGLQFQSDFATLDGNYGFGDGCFGAGGFDPATGACADSSDPTPLPANDYLVEVVMEQDGFGVDNYQVVREEDINVFSGDEFVPQVPPPACAGPLHVVDVASTDGVHNLPDGPNATDNPGFADTVADAPEGVNASPYEGMQRPLCNVKLVTLNNGKSIAPTFNYFTHVPVPGKWRGYIIDDLTLSIDNRSLTYGEKAGIDNMPIGVYDYANNLLTTITSDYNGMYETLLPSTWSINCPTPSGVCPGTYYILGNDPGQPGKPNPNYNPQYRTIGASFEIWPGAILPSDLAPTQVGVSILSPGSNVAAPAMCKLADDTPQLFSVSVPYGLPGQSQAITLQGMGFGDTPGAVTLGTNGLTIVSWSKNQISVRIPTSIPQGPQQLLVTASNGQRTVNGLTFHVLGNNYRVNVYEVGPGKTFNTNNYTPGTFPGPIQQALNAAAQSTGNDLVVVYPGTPAQWNPLGIYYENLVISAPVRLQGVGPGGVRPDGTFALGSVLDGVGVTGDTDYATGWRSYVNGLTWSGNQTVYDGAVVYVLATDGGFQPSFRPSIDGFTIQGGDQQGFPNFLPGAEPGGGGAVTVQGGGIFANGYARYLQITNNILRSNGGAYGGAIRLGTPHLPGAANDNQNDNVRIAYNRILANGGTNLAGAIGVFSGANDYEIAYNDLCGNFSAEYGGGISHYGYSPNGKIHHNRIYYNRSYDEGGGIMIAGELPADPAVLTPGAGPVDIYNNLIQGNLGNDDGGGIRFLMSGNFVYNVYNNLIANNVSTHEGGGISINDAPAVRVFNNTIMKNVTTATAVTSNGFPAPAGLSSSRNSTLLQNTIPGMPVYSNPLVFNNIFWDNRAGTFTGGGVAGIGLQGDSNPINYWDLGVSDGSGLLTPHGSIFQQDTGLYPVGLGAGNKPGVDPLVQQVYDTSISLLPWRGNPRFVDVLLVAVELPPNLLGDYHLQDGSPAKDAGLASVGGIGAPAIDYDNQLRPSGPAVDIGADELGTAQVFPTTPVLDNFNRANGGLGVSWTGYNNQLFYRIDSNNAQVRLPGYVLWSSTVFGGGQEAFFTFAKPGPAATEQDLLLKVQNLTGVDVGNNTSMIKVLYNQAGSSVQVLTYAPSQGWIVRGTFSGVSFAQGDQFGARATPDGNVAVFKNGALIGAASVTTGGTPWPSNLMTGGGRIGVWFKGVTSTNDARFDNFGGGSMPGMNALEYVAPENVLFLPAVLSKH